MDYNLSYMTTALNGATIDVSLLITATLDPANDGTYDITAIGGTWNGQTVTGLLDDGSYGGNDNLFYPAGSFIDPDTGAVDEGYASKNGFGFQVDTSGPGAIQGDDGAGEVNVFSTGSQDDELLNNSAGTPVTNEVLTPACYCPGTLIRTSKGEVAIECLAEGDLVVTHDGALEPIRWIGRRSYAGRFLTGRRDLYPVRIGASALADGVPSRDLLVSPKHAMFLDGVLVSAMDLVNGSTIVWEHGLSRVDYLHLELAGHNVIWAENAASESFVDDDSRNIFQNAAEYDGPRSVGPAIYYAPRVTHGRALETIRLRLDARKPAIAA